MVFFLGLSRSSRRRATVTSSQPEASSAASIASSLAYLPVPRKRRERSVTPATTSGSACVTVCTRQSLPGLASPSGASRHHPREREGGGGWLEVLLEEQRFVAAVGEALHRVVEGKPQQLVDLDPGLESPTSNFHHPVARHLVAAAAVDIRRAAERTHQIASQAGLLADLAKGAVFRGFLGLDLALGQSPVVVLGTMNDCDLGLTGSRI